MLKKLNVRRGDTLPSPPTRQSIKKSDGTKTLAITGSVDGCRPETSPTRDSVCRDPHACGHHMGFISRGFLQPMGITDEKPEFYIKPPLGAALKSFPRGHLLMSFLQGDTSARQQRFEIRVFPSPR